MDLGDALFAFLLPDAGGSRRDSSPGEQVSAAIGCAAFPIADFALVLFAGAWRHFAVAMLLPLAFTAVSVLLSRRLTIGAGATLRIALGCAMLCALASGFAFLLALFGSFYSGF